MIPEHYANALGLNLAVVGAIFTAVRVLDIVIDPVLGAAMDRTRTRWGRYTPWLAFGAPAMMLSVYFLFMAQRGVGPLYLLVGLIAAFLCWSVLSLAQLALAAGIASGYDQRSKVYAWLQGAFMCGTVAVMAFPLLAARLHLAMDPTRLMGWVIIVLTPPAAVFAVSQAPSTLATAAREIFGLRDYLKVIRRPAVLRLAFIDLFFGLGFGIGARLHGVLFHRGEGAAARRGRPAPDRPDGHGSGRHASGCGLRASARQTGGPWHVRPAGGDCQPGLPADAQRSPAPRGLGDGGVGGPMPPSRCCRVQ